jgi:hypothetical protein
MTTGTSGSGATATVAVRPFAVRAAAIGADPAVVSWGGGRVDLVVLDTDGRLRHFTVSGGSCQERPPVPGAAGLTGHPSLISWGPGRLDVFMRDDRGVRHSFFDGEWHGWTSVSPEARRTVGDPVATSWGRGRFDLYVPTNDGSMDHYWRADEVGLQGPEDTGGTFAGRPDASNTGLYSTHLTARDARDGLLRYQYSRPVKRSHSWTSTPVLPRRAGYYTCPPTTVGGADLRCTGDPVILHSRGLGPVANRMLVYARQEDRLLCLEPWAWTGTRNDRVLGAGVGSDAGVASPLRCRADVFVRLDSGALGHLVEEFGESGASRDRWEVIDDGRTAVAGRPAAISCRPGRLDVFFRSVDGELCHGWWDAATDGWNAA